MSAAVLLAGICFGCHAQGRMRWEPLYEATQIKGDGEAHPLLSPNDEFADYESWDRGNMGFSVLKKDLSESAKKAMLAGEYARSGLKRGFQYENSLGAVPFKFGMIGSTDSHTLLTTDRSAEVKRWLAQHAARATRQGRNIHYLLLPVWEQAVSGYAAVWAKENTREALLTPCSAKKPMRLRAHV